MDWQMPQSRIFSVHMKEIPHKFMYILMPWFINEIPVQSHILIPLMKLGKVLSHEKKLLSGMAKHEQIAALQVPELVLIDSGHLVYHGAFKMNNLIMR